MISQGEYSESLRKALLQLGRLLNIGVKAEDIVWIMTYDVYIRAMSGVGYVSNAGCRFTGRDIGVVNEETLGESIFIAAVRGMNYYPGMEAGDAILLDEDDGVARVYYLKTTDPPQFVDGGLTVRFREMPRATISTVAATDGTINCNGMMYSVGSFENYISTHGGYTAYYTPSAPSAWEDVTTVTINGTYDQLSRSHFPDNYIWSCSDKLLTGISENAPEQEEDKPLTPEDTKELDEFLNSLRRGGKDS